MSRRGGRRRRAPGSGPLPPPPPPQSLCTSSWSTACRQRWLYSLSLRASPKATPICKDVNSLPTCLPSFSCRCTRWTRAACAGCSTTSATASSCAASRTSRRSWGSAGRPGPVATGPCPGRPRGRSSRERERGASVLSGVSQSVRMLERNCDILLQTSEKYHGRSEDGPQIARSSEAQRPHPACSESIDTPFFKKKHSSQKSTSFV